MGGLVILSAFGGRLRSEPMEWPIGAEDIRLPMSRSLRVGFDLGIKASPAFTQVAKFEDVGKMEKLQGSLGFARIYEFVGVDG